MKLNREIEPRQAISLAEAEAQLLRASAALDGSDGFEHVSTSLLQAFRTACDQREHVQEANSRGN
jgi:hypothetical protein